MTSFIRKSLVVVSAKFVPPGYEYWNRETNSPNPPPTQPSAAEAVLEFCNTAGAVNTVTLPMTLGSDGITWSCTWDSSASGQGMVKWVVFASGAVQAVNQGQFMILANSPNNF